MFETTAADNTSTYRYDNGNISHDAILHDKSNEDSHKSIRSIDKQNL